MLCFASPVKLRSQILLFLLLFGLLPLLSSVMITLPFVLERVELFFHKAHLQNLRADFRNLDHHLARRNEITRVLAKLPEPGIIFDSNSVLPRNLPQERERYRQWINRLLSNMPDINQILFLRPQGRPSYWIHRDNASDPLLPSKTAVPAMPSQELIAAALKENIDTVLVSPITVTEANGSPQLLLHIVGPVTHPKGGQPIGAVVVTIDIAGMANIYRDTLWVLDNGTYMGTQSLLRNNANAFSDFPGLKEIFAEAKLALWQNHNQQVIWLPIFPTEGGGNLWVGRSVDPSPMAQFNLSLSFRVILIISLLVVLTFLAAHWVARRFERLSSQLTEGVRRVVEYNEPVVFGWRRPRELRWLGEKLTALAQQQQENVTRLRGHARALESSNRYKSAFLANVSHELRTPLNSILLLSKLICDPDAQLPSDALEKARVLHEAASHLKDLIDNILDMSRIEAGHASLNIESVHLPTLLRNICGLMRPQFEAKNIQLNLELEPGATETLVSDPGKITQILQNLLSNSVKFTERGGATLRLHGERPEKRYPICISVEDTGIGIHPSKQTKIFAAFEQADTATNRRYGGSGLGLTISRQLSQLLGGDIFVQSRPGKGSTFALGLPAQLEESHAVNRPVSHQTPEDPDEEADNVSSPIADFNQQSVLLVDDDLQSLLRLTPLLESWRLKVFAADDSTEMIETLSDGDCRLVILNGALPSKELDASLAHLMSLSPDKRPATVVMAKSKDQKWEAADLVLPPPLSPKILQATIAIFLLEPL